MTAWRVPGSRYHEHAHSGVSGLGTGLPVALAMAEPTRSLAAAVPTLWPARTTQGGTASAPLVSADGDHGGPGAADPLDLAGPGGGGPCLRLAGGQWH